MLMAESGYESHLVYSVFMFSPDGLFTLAGARLLRGG